MNLVEYSKIVDQTAIYPKEVKNFGIAYALIGMWDEMNEMMEKMEYPETYSKEEINGEKFDVVWYVCAFCKELGLNFEKVIIGGIEFKQPDDRIGVNPFRMFGLVKKYYRDNKPFDLDQIEILLTSFVSSVLEGITPEEFAVGLQANYDKLIDRRNRNVVSGDGDKR